MLPPSTVPSISRPVNGLYCTETSFDVKIDGRVIKKEVWTGRLLPNEARASTAYSNETGGPYYMDGFTTSLSTSGVTKLVITSELSGTASTSVETDIDTRLVSWYNATVWKEGDVTFYGDKDYAYIPPTPEQQLKQIIRERYAPAVHTGRYRSVRKTEDVPERRARETLRKIIGEEKYRLFLKKGYVCATNRKSGNTYQLFPGYQKTKLFQNNKHVDTLCVVLRGDFPPTDSLIVRYLMVLNNEAEFLKLAIRSGGPSQSFQSNRKTDERPLPEIYQLFKEETARYNLKKSHARTA